MNLWCISRFPLQIPPPLTSCSYNKPQNHSRIILKSSSSSAAPLLPAAARDRVIDFGKHRGKMLGTLPSTYLKWVSKNLRAREFEEWAQLADQVLEDHVYKDRIEWEFAQNVLNGDVLRSSSSSSSSTTPVDELAEISERFGWDYEDKVGWAKVDFGLLGTSKGGRLPRLSTGSDPTLQTSKVGTTSRLSYSGPRPSDMGSDPTLQTSKVGTISRLSSSRPRHSDIGSDPTLQTSKAGTARGLSSFGSRPSDMGSDPTLQTSKASTTNRFSSSGLRPSDMGSDPTLQTSKAGTTSRLSSSGSIRSNMGSDPTLQTSKAGTTSRVSSSRPRPVKDVGEKRRERMERMKLRRRNGNLEENRESRVSLGNSSEVVVLKTRNGGGNVDKEESARTNIDKSSFPGREGLLKKVLKRRGQ